MNENDIDVVTNYCEKARERTFRKTKSKLVDKFEKLQHQLSKKRQENNFFKNAVLNLTDRELPNNQMDLLNLGPKFVPTVKKIPFMDIITTTEIKAIELEKKEKPFEAERLRQSVQQKKAKKPTSNLTKDQSVALRELKTDNNFDVYPFDKGSGFVIINHEDALKRIEDQIGHTKKVNRDPTKSCLLYTSPSPRDRG